MEKLNKVESGSIVRLDGRQHRLIAWSNLYGGYKLVPVSGGGEAVYRSWATTVEVVAPPPAGEAEAAGGAGEGSAGEAPEHESAGDAA